MGDMHMKYVMRALVLMLLYLSGKNVKKEAAKLADQIQVIFKEDFS